MCGCVCSVVHVALYPPAPIDSAHIHALSSFYTTTTPTKTNDSADSGPLWDGSRVRIAPSSINQTKQQQPPFRLHCSFTPPTTPGYPYWPLETKSQKQHHTFIMQLALPAAWPHGRVTGVSRRLDGTRPQGGGGGGSGGGMAVAMAKGGWKEVAAVVEEEGLGLVAADAWAWDGEEQGTLWVRVSTTSGEGGGVGVVLSFGEEEEE